LRCNAKEVVERCASVTAALMQETYGAGCKLPQVRVQGHLDATFPYILSHLEYIVGELLRNSMQATMERSNGKPEDPRPIDVLICETSQNVIIRVSDRGGGISPDMLHHLWSFCKGPYRNMRLKNLHQVPRMAATMQEVKLGGDGASPPPRDSSLSSLASRPPDLKLGIGLPMSKIYAEYWAGSLEIHSLEGYGVDAFLQISRLGNKNEHISTRATMDAV
jgi:pyruvate dehydrogenase kinase 2/3/4